jgi:hypothetical protein
LLHQIKEESEEPSLESNEIAEYETPFVESEEMAQAREEIAMLKSELEKVKAAFEATRAESMASKASIAELEDDKKKMRQNITASRRRISDQYADHAVLQALAEEIENLQIQTK